MLSKSYCSLFHFSLACGLGFGYDWICHPLSRRLGWCFFRCRRYHYNYCHSKTRHDDQSKIIYCVLINSWVSSLFMYLWCPNCRSHSFLWSILNWWIHFDHNFIAITIPTVFHNHNRPQTLTLRISFTFEMVSAICLWCQKITPNNFSSL